MSKPSAPRTYRRIGVAFAALAAIALCVSFSPLYAKRDSTKAMNGIAKNSQNNMAALKQRALANYAALPVSFEPNQGQASPEVRYVARSKGYSLYLTSSGATMQVHRRDLDSEVLSMMRNRRLGPAEAMRMLQERRHNTEANQSYSASVRMQMVNENPKARLVASDMEPGKVNYLVGRDRAKWHSDIPLYGRVEYKQVYDGVDVAFHAKGQQVEFDYLVKPNADAAQIALRFDGAEKVRTTAEGNLVLSTAAGDVQLLKPVAYQGEGASRKLVDAGFVVKGNHVSFRLGEYDRSRELVIDPTLIYSTYFGGSLADYGTGIAVDSSGNEYVTGTTDSQTLPGNSTGTNAGSFDVFLTKISPAGALVYTTLFGGSVDDVPGGIAVDSQAIYIAGTTDSPDFPVTTGAAQTTFQGGGTSGNNDAFAASITLDGANFNWSTYIGGNDSDSGLGVAVDSSHNVYVVGETFSTNLPVKNPLASGTALNLGKTTSTPIDDGYIAVVNSAGSSFNMVSYIGGSSADTATGVALDSTGNVYICGATTSSDFPVTNGVVQSSIKVAGNDNAFVVAIAASSFASAKAQRGLRAAGSNDGAPRRHSLVGFWLALPGLAIVSICVSCGSSRRRFLGVLLMMGALALLPSCGGSSSGGGGGGGCTTAPSAPTGLAASGTTSSGTNLSWNAVTPPASCTISSYTVLQNGKSIGTATSTSFAVTGLAASTTYSFTVEATDAAGASSASSAVSVTTLSGNATLIYSTYFGGSTGDDALGIAADSTGNVFFVGNTRSADFPVSNPTFQGTLGGTQNAFVVGLNSTGTNATYSTFLGGNGTDTALGVTVDSNDVVYVTGQTSSANFPTASPTQVAFGGSTDAFVSVIDPAKNTLTFSTWLGGSGDENQFFASIALDSSQNVYVTGDTDSGNGGTTPFPLAGTPIQLSWQSGGTCTSNNTNVPCPDAFVTAITKP